MSALKDQVGGNHYKDLKIQPIEYCLVNKLNNIQSSIVRYATRYPNKNKAEDLKKIIHCAQIALELEYGVHSEVTYDE